LEWLEGLAFQPVEYGIVWICDSVEESVVWRGNEEFRNGEIGVSL